MKHTTAPQPSRKKSHLAAKRLLAKNKNHHTPPKTISLSAPIVIVEMSVEELKQLFKDIAERLLVPFLAAKK